MCFYTVSVERRPDGRLVQTRPRAPRPVREVPTAPAIQQQPVVHHIPDFVDQFTGVVPSPQSSDDSEQSSGQKASKSKHKAKTKAKDEMKKS
ncbi:MAG: hypothetical protein Q9183_006223, partial [Haloplaca sp. 2 TL-2023]